MQCLVFMMSIQRCTMMASKSDPFFCYLENDEVNADNPILLVKIDTRNALVRIDGIRTHSLS